MNPRESKFFSNLSGTSVSNFFHNKWVLAILAFDALLIVVLIILIIINNTKSSTLVLNVTPIDSKITINGGGEYSAVGTYNLTPGHYKVEISHPDLVSKTFEIDLDPDHNANITTFLSAEEGDLEFYLQKSNLGSFNKLKEITTKNENITSDQDVPDDMFISTLEYDRSMMSLLPINETQYSETDYGRELLYDITIRANYGDDCSTWLCLEALMLGTEDEEIVNQILTDHGFAAEDYEIKYTIY